MAETAVADKDTDTTAASETTKAAEDTAHAAEGATTTSTADKAAETSSTTTKAETKAEPFNPAQVTLPEGGLVDESDRARIIAMAQANTWTTAQAQDALAELDAVYDRQRTDFLEVTKNDSTYGGAQLAKTQQLARSVIDFVRPEGHPRRDSFLAFFEKNGAGNHLEVLSFLADLGHAMAEDGGARVGAPRPDRKAPENLAQALYAKPAKAS